ncbi:MAG TPA: hypothetical protein VH092_23215 [Urbifossiella sp.]|nr:hypothetical protein [Urbifossiella sp.]
MSAMVEKVAKAISQWMNCERLPHPPNWERLQESTRRAYRVQAQAAIAAMGEPPISSGAEARGAEGVQPPSPAIHVWKDHPDVTTTPVKCLLCYSEAAAIVYAPNGCTCSPNKYQPRCEQHLRRAWDTGEDIIVVEDFRLPSSATLEAPPA